MKLLGDSQPMKNVLRTSDIFTDCESACDKDSFVLPRFELKALVNGNGATYI